MPLLSKSRKTTGSARCRSEHPATCRYHGVKQPMTFKESEAALEQHIPDLASQRFDINMDAQVATHDAFKRYSLGEEHVKGFDSAKEMMARVYPASQVTKENYEQIQEQAWNERAAEKKQYLESLAITLFPQDEDKQFIAKHGTKAKFALDQAKKNNYPTSTPGSATEQEDIVRVKIFARDNGMDTARVMGKFIPINHEAYKVNEARYSSLLFDPKFNQDFAVFTEAKKSLSRNNEVVGVKDKKFSVTAIRDYFSAGKAV